MAITLAQAKVGMANKVDQNIIDLIQRNSTFMNALTWDDAVAPGTGGSTLTYGYLQTLTPASAAGRSLNNEYTAQHAIKTSKTVDLQIMGGSFEIDRVIAKNSSKRNDEVTYQITEKTKATVSRFQYLAINGDKATTNEFDGLNSLLANTENEILAPSVDVHGAMTAAHAEDLCEALDLAIASLDGTPSMILCNTDMKVKLVAAARMLNYKAEARDEFGRAVDTYGDTPIVDMKQYYNGSTTVNVIPTRSAIEYRVKAVTATTFATDGTFAGSADGYLYTESSGTYTKVNSGSYNSATTYYIKLAAAKTTDIYVVRLALDGFHAVSPQEQGVGLTTILPNFNNEGAVHKGEVEMVGAVALKSTKAAAVLRGIIVKG